MPKMQTSNNLFTYIFFHVILLAQCKILKITESHQIKFICWVQIQFISSIFSLMINYLNK